MAGDWKIGQKVTAIGLVEQTEQCSACGGGGFRWDAESGQYSKCVDCVGCGRVGAGVRWAVVGTGRQVVLQVLEEAHGRTKLILQETPGPGGQPVAERRPLPVDEANVFHSRGEALAACLERNSRS